MAAGTVSVKLSGDARGLLDALQTIASASGATSDEVKADFSKAAAEIDAMMSDLKVKADQAKAEAVAARAEADATKDSSSGGAADAEKGMSGLLKAALLVGPAMVPIAAVGAILAAGLVPALGAAAVGLEAFNLAGGAVKVNFEADASSMLTSWQKAMAPIVSPVYSQALGLIGQSFALLTPVVQGVSEALVTVERNLSASLSSPFFKDFFSWLGGAAKQAIIAFGDAGIYGITGLMELFKALAPVTTMVENGIVALGKAFDTASQKFAAGNDVTKMMAAWKTYAPIVGNLFENLGKAAWDVGKALAPLGAVILKVADGLSKIIARNAEPVLGTLSKTASGLFKAVSPLGPILDDVAKGLGNIIKNDAAPVFQDLVQWVQNFVGYLVPLRPQIDELLGDLGKSLHDLIAPINTLKEGGIDKQLAELVGDFLKMAPAVLKVVDALAKFLAAHPKLLEMATVFLGIYSQVNKIVGPMNSVARAASGLASAGGTVKDFAGKIGLIAPAAKEAGDGMKAGEAATADASEGMMGAIGPVALGVAGLAVVGYELYEHWGTIWSGIQGVASEAGSAVSGALGGIESGFSTVGSTISNAFTGAAGWLVNQGTSIVTGLGSGISSAWSTVSGFFTGLPSTIGSLLSDAGEWLVNVGQEIISGLINGLEQAAEGIGSSIDSIGGDMVSGFESFFGISSPSKLMADMIGAPITAGIAAGIVGNKTAIPNAINQVTSGLAAGINVGGKLSAALTGGVVGGGALSSGTLGGISLGSISGLSPAATAAAVAASSGGGAGSGDLTVNVQLGSAQTLASALVPAFRQTQLRQVHRNATGGQLTR